ncbi:MAG: hypothetical protein ACNI27_04090 [Desulfovibrio sp.]
MSDVVVTAELDDTSVGTLDNASYTTGADGVVTFVFTPDASAPATVNSEFLLTFTATKADAEAVYMLPGSFYDSTTATADSISLAVVRTGGSGPAELDIYDDANTTTTATYAVTATVGVLGTGNLPADEYFMNFYAPAGSLFVTARGETDNLIVPITGALANGGTVTLTDAADISANPVLKATDEYFEDGMEASFEAVMLDSDQNELAPYVSGESDYRYAVHAANTIESILLEAHNNTDASYDNVLVFTGEAAGDQVNINKIRGQINTWETYLGGSYATPADWADYKFRLNPTFGVNNATNKGFVSPNNGDNVTVTTEVKANIDGNGVFIIDGAGNTGWDYYVSKAAGTDNTDTLSLYMYTGTNPDEFDEMASDGVLLIFE